MAIKVLLCIYFIIYVSESLAAQVTAGMNRRQYVIHIRKTDVPVVIDGLLNDPAWQTAERAGHFHRVLPTDTGYAAAQTEVMLTRDDKNLYVGIICHDTLPGKRPIESLRRDFSFPKNDNFIVFMDTYNDQTNGFAFGISAAGVQWEGIQANGGFVSLDWDCKWKSTVKNYRDRWTAEFAIPFRSIRYKVGVKKWGINFSRLDLKTAEKSSWAPVPRQFQTANLAFTGTLVWDTPPPDLGMRFSLIPYIMGNTSKNFENRTTATTKGNAGIDAKVTLSTSMNLDLTVLPDYSQVEVDRQVINMDRYELFFPEKRKFFQENSDLFASLGKDRLRPFFSRRIGLESPVIAGARLSGQTGNKWRIGMMNIQTGTKDAIPAANFTVATFQRQILDRSHCSFFLVNKQITSAMDDSATTALLRYNRIAGAEFNLASKDNRWTGKMFYHQAFYPGGGNQAFAASGNIEYNTKKLLLSLNNTWVGKSYMAESGYVPRRGYEQIQSHGGYKFYPHSKHIANHGPSLATSLYFSPDGRLTDRTVNLGYGMGWLSRSKLNLALTENYIQLLRPFDPTNTGGVMLPAGSKYEWREMSLSYLSDVRKLFNFELLAQYGGYFNGTRTGMNGELNYRIQPYANLAAVFSYYRIYLPEPYSDAWLILIGPRLDLTFTRNVFLTTFVQYNNQIDNININIRFQWRFAPVSDLYIVYTNNSYPSNLKSKDGALVLKLSYWFH